MAIVERGLNAWFGGAVREWTVDTTVNFVIRYLHPMEAEHYSFRTLGSKEIRGFTQSDVRIMQVGRFFSIHVKSDSPGRLQLYSGANLALIANVEPGFWAEVWLVDNSSAEGLWEVRQLWDKGREILR